MTTTIYPQFRPTVLTVQNRDGVVFPRIGDWPMQETKVEDSMANSWQPEVLMYVLELVE